MPRTEQISNFLKNAGILSPQIKPLANDASFRRYDRVTFNEKITVLMDAPPELEDIRPFVAIAEFLLQNDLNAPNIYAKDFDKGFLLLEDLGDRLFKHVLDKEPDREIELYKNAVDELIKLNACATPDKLSYGSGEYKIPTYDTDLLLVEIALFTDWYYPALTGHRLSFTKREEFIALWRTVLHKVGISKECLVLRDYHAENLLDLGDGKVGQLDFQDAVIGHSAYDL
ncbi:MAG: phosphotransferase, partial [Kordiimonadaceae bacterium]|nr:phosphotransferase [Kordiimonadaceae bacterium]